MPSWITNKNMMGFHILNRSTMLTACGAALPEFWYIVKFKSDLEGQSFRCSACKEATA